MKIKKSSIFIVSIVVGNLILLYLNIIKTEKNLFENTLEINKKENLIKVLKDLNKIKFRSIDEESESFKTLFNQQDFKLIIFFTPNDCPACLKEIKLWNKIYNEISIPVIGIVPYYNIHQVKLFSFNERIQFPVFVDIEEKLLHKIDFAESPIKILLNKKNDIISITTAFLSLKIEKEFFSFVKNLKAN